MPTISQLPAATAVGPNDRVMIDQSGKSVAVRAADLLANTQAALTMAQGAVLARVTAGPGGPQPVPLGAGLTLRGGVLAADLAVVASVDSAALTGVPTAPTRAVGDNTAAVATTAFVAASQPVMQFVGDVLGSGSSPVTLILPPIATPGVFTRVSINAKGQVTAGTGLRTADVVAGLGYTPYDAANPQGFAVSAQLGSLARQNAAAVAVTGGSIGGADVSAAVSHVGGGVARTVAQRLGDTLNLLDYGADPSGGGDNAVAFAAAFAAVPAGGSAQLCVPPGVYALAGVVAQPPGVRIGVRFDDGATLSGNGYLAVERVESVNAAFRVRQTGGGFGPFAPTASSPQNFAFDQQVIESNSGNSAATRVAWGRSYSNINRYAKYSGGIDFAEQNAYVWPRLLDNSSGWGHWEIVSSSTYDEDTAGRAQLGASAEHSEFDVVNNGPDFGWTFASGLGTPVQGMSMDPWGQNGLYGGHILYAYGTVGSYDGLGGGLNERWVSYPALYGSSNPAAVPRGSTLVITFDATAHASATVSAGVVSGASVTVGGGGYNAIPTVAFGGGGGSGAAGLATILGGAVVAVTMTSGGHGYGSAPSVTFVGGGVAAPVPTTVTLNLDGAHGDLASVAASIRAAAIPRVGVAVGRWGGAVARLVVFGTAPGDIGTLTLGGSALAVLGLAAGSSSTPRDDTAIAFSASPSVSIGDQITVNGVVLTVGGGGTQSDIAAAVNAANLPGLRGDTTANGKLVLTAWMLTQPGGLVLDQPAGFTTLQKLGWSRGAILPPPPPKAFATAMGEIGAGACLPTDAITLSATDLSGATFGPLTVTLSGGGGTGSVADVAASITAAVQVAGWWSPVTAALTTAPNVVNVNTRAGGVHAGLIIRNTAGGTLTLANAAGSPLDTLGMTAGSYQPGGYSAASQTVFHAAPDAIAPQGRGVFLGGATAPDPVVWPHAPVEARGNFAHGLRLDKAQFGDGAAVLMAAGQALAWAVGGARLSGTPAALTSNVPLVLPGLQLTALPTSPAGLQAGTIWNNSGVLSIA